MKKWLDTIEKQMGSDFRESIVESFFRTLYIMVCFLILCSVVGFLVITCIALFTKSPETLLWLIPLTLVTAVLIFILNLLDSWGVWL